jgi:hypothetical protein
MLFNTEVCGPFLIYFSGPEDTSKFDGGELGVPTYVILDLIDEYLLQLLSFLSVE